MSDKVRAVIIPPQPDHLDDAVKDVLTAMHENPEKAADCFYSWKRANNSLNDFSGATLQGVKLNGTMLQNLCFRNAVFVNCDLRGANFDRSDLTRAKFVRVQFSRDTQFHHAESVSKCSMERYALACLGPERGGLTEGNLMDMEIVDYVAELRLKFSGFWAWLHVLSIVSFFFPYVWFLIMQWGRARFMNVFVDANKTITLFEALGRFIWNGGRDWQSGWHLDFWAMFRFVAVLLYQAVRFTLLAKTKSLEMHQVVTGLPARFSLDQPSDGWEVPYVGWRIGKGFRWRRAMQFVNVFIVVTILMALWNVIHFLGMRIPVKAE